MLHEWLSKGWVTGILATVLPLNSPNPFVPKQPEVQQRSGLLARANPVNHEWQGKEGDHQDRTAMEKDHLYCDLLNKMRTLEAVWKQQPGNRPALDRCCSQVEVDVKRLGEITAPKEASSPVPAPDLAKPGTVAAPQGPVPPSSTPPSLEEKEKRMKYTLEKTHLPGPREGKGGTSLAGVPDDWLHKQCTLAEGKIAEIRKLLDNPTPDQIAVAKALDHLHDLINQFDNSSRKN